MRIFKSVLLLHSARPALGKSAQQARGRTVIVATQVPALVDEGKMYEDVLPRMMIRTGNRAA